MTFRRAISSTRARVRRRLAVALAAVLTAGSATACGGVPTPTSELNSGQAVLDLGSMVVDLREDNAALQSQIDSLRQVLAYQDTIVRQLAAGAGVTMRPPVRSLP